LFGLHFVSYSVGLSTIILQLAPMQSCRDSIADDECP